MKRPKIPQFLSKLFVLMSTPLPPAMFCADVFLSSYLRDTGVFTKKQPCVIIIVVITSKGTGVVEIRQTTQAMFFRFYPS